MITTGLRPKSLVATLRRVRHDLAALADVAQAGRVVGFSSHVNERAQPSPDCPVHRKEAMLMFVSIFSEGPDGKDCAHPVDPTEVAEVVAWLEEPGKHHTIHLASFVWRNARRSWILNGEAEDSEENGTPMLLRCRASRLDYPEQKFFFFPAAKCCVQTKRRPALLCSLPGS